MANPRPGFSDLSRRHLLGLGAATAAGSLLPASLLTAMAATPMRKGGGLDDIEHVVVFMQENRSFDHYFGTLQGARGFGDTTVLPTRDGHTLFAQPTAGGARVLPFLVREARDAGNHDIEWIASLPHGFGDGALAWAGGWEDRWVPAKGPSTMACYDRRDIAFQYELADRFTLCDGYFSSMMTSTSPNRNYLFSGNSAWEPGHLARAVGNDAYEVGHAGYDWTTYQSHLERAGVSWQILQEWDNFTDNNEIYFRPYKRIARTIYPDHRGDDETFWTAVREADAATARTLLDGLERRVAALSPGEQSLYRRAMHRVPTGTLAATFRGLVERGELPRVTHVVASAADSEHPGSSSPVQSATLTHDLLEVLGDHPEVWAKTVVLLTYDEFDGYFDHVAHPVPPVGDPDEWWLGHPTGFGARVPMLVISPWSMGGWINSQTFDHTSVIRFLERWTGVRTPEITEWRRRVSGDLTSTLNLTGEPAPTLPSLSQPGAVPTFTERWKPTPPLDQQVPRQEPGVRPACALPYSLEATLTGDVVTVRNAGRASAHLSLHDYSRPHARPQHADVRGEAELPLGHSRPGELRTVVVSGPNRFRRDWTTTQRWVRVDGVTRGRELAVTLENRAGRALHFRVSDQATAPVGGFAEARTVVVPPRRSHHLRIDTRRMGGWYDVRVEVEVPEERGRRHTESFWLTGRIEDGRAGITSPFSSAGRWAVPGER